MRAGLRFFNLFPLLSDTRFEEEVRAIFGWFSCALPPAASFTVALLFLVSFSLPLSILFACFYFPNDRRRLLLHAACNTHHRVVLHFISCIILLFKFRACFVAIVCSLLQCLFLLCTFSLVSRPSKALARYHISVPSCPFHSRALLVASLLSSRTLTFFFCLFLLYFLSYPMQSVLCAVRSSRVCVC